MAEHDLFWFSKLVMNSISVKLSGMHFILILYHIYSLYALELSTVVVVTVNLHTHSSCCKLPREEGYVFALVCCLVGLSESTTIQRVMYKFS